MVILALFLTDFWTLNSGRICQTLGMAVLPGMIGCFVDPTVGQRKVPLRLSLTPSQLTGPFNAGPASTPSPYLLGLKIQKKLRCRVR